MKVKTLAYNSSGVSRVLGLLVMLGFVSSLACHSAVGGSATWNVNPGSGDWNTASNWSPATVPDGASDIATFNLSNTTVLAPSLSTEVSGIVFAAGASAYVLTVNDETTLTVSGAGITNNSGNSETIVTPSDSYTALIQFHNSAMAGSGTVFSNGAAYFPPDIGGVHFYDTSSAGSAVFTNTAPAGVLSGGAIEFHDNSTAGNSTITNEGFPTFNHNHTFTLFGDTSSAGSATIIANSGSARRPTTATCAFPLAPTRVALR